MGYMEHLVESRLATRFTGRAMLPTVSRTNYETLHTGLPASDHGVTSNGVVRKSTAPNTFSLAAAAGLKTGAVAYSWVSELYQRCPFDRMTDYDYDEPEGPIHHGRFYTADDQPDIDTFGRAVNLTASFLPDYLLVHPMGADHAGHVYGGNSVEYRNKVLLQDQALGVAVPIWLEQGYSIIVTADHGAGSDGAHGGTDDEVRLVPLYVVDGHAPGRGDTGEIVDTTRVAPTVMSWLGLALPPEVNGAPLDG
jgi:predicted AlkP superfamily pyrophosphatase or phosphodiesterase